MAGFTDGYSMDEHVNEHKEMIRYRKIAQKIKRRRAVAVCLGAAAILGAAFLVINIRQPVIVAGDCMRYTIEDGGKCTVNRLAYIFNKPGYNDLIIYRNGKETKISRVLALPGDKVEIREGEIKINGRPAEVYIEVPEEAELKLILPEDNYYVLPDVPEDISEGRNCIQFGQISGRVSAD